MFCQKCGQQNDSHAQYCTGCGKKIGLEGRHGRRARRKKVIIGIVVLLALAIIGGYGTKKFWPQPESKVLEANAPNEATKQITKEEIENPKKLDESEIEKEKVAVIKEAMPKVFTVFTESGHGSGFLYEKGGYIVTNAHVVAGYTNVVIRNSDNEDSPGKVIGISDYYDIALIRAMDYQNAEPLGIEKETSDVGTEVIAIGSPQGFENTATIGYLTGTDRDFEQDFVYENIYQIDAQIDQGNSGGPLLDAKNGKVIGINSLLYKGNVSFGFSIPMYSMIEVVNDWIQFPMSEQEVANKFGVYEEYAYYDEAIQDEFRSYYEEYWEDDDWDFYYDEVWDEDWEEEVEEENYAEEEEEEIVYFHVDELADFIFYFREDYTNALQEQSFAWVEESLLPGSSAAQIVEETISSVAGEGVTLRFLGGGVQETQVDGNLAKVYMYETIEAISNEDEREVDSRKITSIYTVVSDENHNYQIMDIEYNVPE